MSDIILEIKDRRNRKIKLSEKYWKHTLEHPEMSNQLENIRSTVEHPQAIKKSENDDSVKYYYKYFEDSPTDDKYLLVAVKYLNGEGFIITAFYANKIVGKNE